MILAKPYDFESLKREDTHKLISEISKYITLEYGYIRQKEKVHIKPFKGNDITLTPVLLYGLTDTEKDITPFYHPLINMQQRWIALDLRHLVKLSPDKESYNPRNDNELSFALRRFVLSGMWAIGKQDTIYSLSFAHFTYASWLSENLARKFGLDLSNQMQLKTLAYIYYTHLFSNKFDDDDFLKLKIRLKSELFTDGLLEEVFEKVDRLETIDDFCLACYKVTDNIRLKNLDKDVLKNILSNNWLGLRSYEMATLAIEHPPTWIALVYASLTHQFYKKTIIGTTVDKLDRKNKGKEFLNDLVLITSEYKDDSNE